MFNKLIQIFIFLFLFSCTQENKDGSSTLPLPVGEPIQGDPILSFGKESNQTEAIVHVEKT